MIIYQEVNIFTKVKGEPVIETNNEMDEQDSDMEN